LARILHITEALGGGIAYSVPLLMRSQSDAGHEVILLYSRRRDTPSEEALDRLLPAPIRREQLAMVREISPVQDLGAVLAVRKAVRRLDPDVVHLHSSKAGAVGRLAVIGLSHDRVFYSPRGVSFLRKGVGRFGPGIYRLAEWVLARISGTIVAVSPSERDVIGSELSLDSVKLLENAVEVPLVPKKVAERSGAGSPLRVVTAGRISWEKAPWRFGDLARQFANTCKFTWVGEGEGKERWFDGAEVEVTGWVKVEEVRRRVAEADVFLLLSEYEGLPVALIESQVSGLPAVVTDVVGCRDVVVSEETGFVVKDVDEAARALQRLLDEPALRRRLGARASLLASQRFDSRTLAQRSLEVYGLAAPEVSKGSE